MRDIVKEGILSSFLENPVSAEKQVAIIVRAPFCFRVSANKIQLNKYVNELSKHVKTKWKVEASSPYNVEITNLNCLFAYTTNQGVVIGLRGACFATRVDYAIGFQFRSTPLLRFFIETVEGFPVVSVPDMYVEPLAKIVALFTDNVDDLYKLFILGYMKSILDAFCFIRMDAIPKIAPRSSWEYFIREEEFMSQYMEPEEHLMTSDILHIFVSQVFRVVLPSIRRNWSF